MNAVPPLVDRIEAFFADELMCNRNPHGEKLLREAADALKAKDAEIGHICKGHRCVIGGPSKTPPAPKTPAASFNIPTHSAPKARRIIMVIPLSSIDAGVCRQLGEKYQEPYLTRLADAIDATVEWCDSNIRQAPDFSNPPTGDGREAGS